MTSQDWGRADEDRSVVVRTADRMGLGDWRAITKMHRPQLKDSPFSPSESPFTLKIEVALVPW